MKHKEKQYVTISGHVHTDIKHMCNMGNRNLDFLFPNHKTVTRKISTGGRQYQGLQPLYKRTTRGQEFKRSISIQKMAMVKKYQPIHYLKMDGER